MPSKERIICACGGELKRPLPARCPHCNQPIVAVRRTLWKSFTAFVLVVAIFVALVAATWWLATQW